MKKNPTFHFFDKVGINWEFPVFTTST